MVYDMKKLFLSVLLAALMTDLCAQTPFTISRRQASDDLDTLCAKIKEIHPDPFTVCTEEALRRSLRDEQAALPDSLPVRDLFLRASRLAAMIGDGHTGVRFPASDGSAPLIPLAVRIGDDTLMYARADFSQGANPVPSGARIERINGTGTKKLLAEMMRYVSGERPFYRLTQIGDRFGEYLSLLYSGGEYEIEYRDGQHKRSVKMVPIPASRYFKALRAFEAQQGDATPSEPYTFRVVSGNVGLIAYNACTDFDRFRRFLDSAFTVVRDRQIDRLIVDARRNEGGNSELNDELFQYISPVPFSQCGAMLFRISAPVRQRFGGLPDMEDGIRRTEDELTPLRENPLRFRGKTFLLVSHRTFSSAGLLSNTYKQFRMGTVVGQESGGMNLHFGELIPVTLPHSGLQAYTSCKMFYPYGPFDGKVHGTLPDYEVPAGEALDYTLKHLVGKP